MSAMGEELKVGIVIKDATVESHGYGFVKPMEHGTPDVYFAKTACMGYKPVRGDVVIYIDTIGEKGPVASVVIATRSRLMNAERSRNELAEDLQIHFRNLLSAGARGITGCGPIGGEVKAEGED